MSVHQLVVALGLTGCVFAAEIPWKSSVTGQNGEQKNIGTFWQLTDIHYDANYTTEGSPQSMCHHVQGEVGHAGKFGEYLCDSPWALAVSAAEAMLSIHPEPDFILWTGDNFPHVPDSTTNTEKVFITIHNVTRFLHDIFPSTPVYPSIGNHDSWPANQVPSGPDSYYETLLDYCGWDKMVPPNQFTTFRKGGYYSVMIQKKVKLINLNTNLWYLPNNQTIGLQDPADQLRWLEEELAESRKNYEMVVIAGHIGVGLMDKPWFHQHISKQFLSLIQEYDDVIQALFYGHEHTDQFRIVNDKNGNPSVPVFLGPAVTPWTGNMSWGANNPSIRLYRYDQNNGKILEILQYYLNLTAANVEDRADWLMEYEFTKTYGIPDLSARSLRHLADKFVPADSELFLKYYVHYQVSNKPVPCSQECKQRFICSILEVDYDDNEKCKNSVEVMVETAFPPAEEATSTRRYPAPPPPPHPDKPHHPHRAVPRYMYIVIYSLVILVIVLFAGITAYCCCREPRRATYLTQPRYVLIS